MQKGLYDKIVVNQQISEIWEILISLAMKLEAQFPGALKKHNEHKTLQFTETQSSNSETTSTQKIKF